MTTVKSVRISSKGQFVIPKELRDELELESGSELVIFRRGEALVLMRSHDFAEHSRGAVRNVWGQDVETIDADLSTMRDRWD